MPDDFPIQQWVVFYNKIKKIALQNNLSCSLAMCLCLLSLPLAHTFQNQICILKKSI